MLDFRPPEWRDGKFMSFRWPGLEHFAMVTQETETIVHRTEGGPGVWYHLKLHDERFALRIVSCLSVTPFVTETNSKV